MLLTRYGNGMWIAKRAMWRWKWSGHDCLFVALWRFRLRLFLRGEA